MHYSDRLCIVSCIFSEYSEYHVSTLALRVLKGVKEFWLTANALWCYHAPGRVEIVNQCYYPVALYPTPPTDSRHRATERATVDAEQTGKANHPRRDGRGTDGHPGRQAQPERMRGRSSAGTLGEIGQAKTGRATRRPSEPRRAPRTGTAPAEGHSTAADADRAQRGKERRTRHHI